MAQLPGRLTAAALTIAALALAVLAEPARPAAAPKVWREASSGPVQVVSDGNAADTLALLQRVVTVRNLVERATGRWIGDAAEPVLVLAPNGRDGMRELIGRAAERNPGLLVAAALPSPFGHHLALRADARQIGNDALVLHEYVHLVTAAEFDPIPPPAWIDEGLSEFWSTLVARGDRLDVGAPIGAFVRALRRGRGWIPIAELVRAPRGRYDTVDGKLEMFYAESWALVHYLLLKDRTPAMTYAPQLPADLEPLDDALRAYVRTPIAGVALEPRDVNSQTAGAITIRELPEPEALAIRASVMAYGENPEAGVRLASRAVALDANQPLATEAIGIICFLTNRGDEARSWLEKAVSLPGAGYRSHYYYGIVAAGTPSIAAKHFRRSLELRPGFGPAAEWLAAVSKYLQTFGRFPL